MLIAFMLGSDSFVAAAAIAPALSSTAAKVRLVLLFAVCDGLASLFATTVAPAGLAQSPAIAAVRVSSLLAAALYVAVAVALARPLSRGVPIYFVPILLSLDNLLAPGSNPAEAALASGALALAGVILGSLVGRALDRAASSRGITSRLVRAAPTMLLMAAALLPA